MNITRTDTGELTATISLELSPEDYKEKVDETLRSYRKKANIPGFRPGKVPFGVINRMYGKATLMEEVYKIMSDSVYKYIEENKLDIFGSPMINNDKAKEIDWEESDVFSFEFDIAIIPNIEIGLNEDIKLSRYNIQPSKEDTNKYLKDIRERYGKFDPADEVGEGQFIYGELTELNEAKEGAFQKHVSFWIRDLNKTLKELVIGRKKDEQVEFDIDKIFDDKMQLSELFKIQAEELNKLSGNFSLKLVSIMNIIPAELNEDLFTKVFPDQKIANEEELLNKIQEDIKGTYRKESQRQFFYEAQDELKKQYEISVPEEFLKKWLKQNSEKDLSDEDINKGFDSYAEHLRWQVIENKIITKFEIKATKEEFRQHIKELIGMGHINEENDPESKKRIDEIIESVAQKEEDIKRIYDAIYEQKLSSLFTEKCTIKEKDTTWEEFLTLVQKK